MPSKWSEDKRNYAVELYLSGLSQRKVAEVLGSDQKFIGSILRKAGVSRSLSAAANNSWNNGRVPYQLIKGIDIQASVASYISGNSLTDIGRQLGVDQGVVKRRLKQAGVDLRSRADVRSLIDWKQLTTKSAKSRSRLIGRGEDVLFNLLRKRGEVPDRQTPVGTRNIDLSVHPIAVEVYAETGNPFKNPYCLQRSKEISDAGWSLIYVWIARGGVLISAVADEIVRLIQLSRRDPSILSKHRVIRGCGELAATASRDFNNVTYIPPSKTCPHHSTINKRFSN